MVTTTCLGTEVGRYYAEVKTQVMSGEGWIRATTFSVKENVSVCVGR